MLPGLLKTAVGQGERLLQRLFEGRIVLVRLEQPHPRIRAVEHVINKTASSFGRRPIIREACPVP